MVSTNTFRHDEPGTSAEDWSRILVTRHFPVA